jgi:FkbM family methyltransferase
MKAGYSMFLDRRVPEQRLASETGIYEDDVLSVATKLMPDDGVFVDVGANIGFYVCAVGAAVAATGGEVIAFEPVASNRRRLRKNVALNRLGGVVTVVPLALGAEPRRLVMRRVPIGRAANAVGENMFSAWDREDVDRHGWHSEEVDVVPLDEWSHRLRRCDVLKIDVEGADLLVLLGATRTIHRFRPVIFAEFNPYWMRQIGQSLDDVRRFARGSGYRVARLFDCRFQPLPPAHADSDHEVPNYLLVPEEKGAVLPEVLLPRSKNPPTAGHPV